MTLGPGGTLNTSGAGRINLNGAMSGGSIVCQGTLAIGGTVSIPGQSISVNGTIGAGALLNFSPGAVLAGNGSINSNTTIPNNVTVSPGDNGIGTLSWPNSTLTEETGSRLRIEIAGAHDRIRARNFATFQMTLQLVPTSAQGGHLCIVNVLNGLGPFGNFAGLPYQLFPAAPVPALNGFNGCIWRISYEGHCASG